MSLTRTNDRSSVIEAETYLLACMRYIELNAVRAEMVKDPGHYRWSSYRHNGLGQSDRRVTPHPLFLSFDQDAAERQATYRALFRSELDEEAIADIRLALAQGQPLGESRFSDRICAAAGVRRTQKRPGRQAHSKEQPINGGSQIEFGF